MSTDGPGPTSTGEAPPAGWYDDPDGGALRWWDGSAWTGHRQPTGYVPVRPRNPFATAGLVVGIVALVGNTFGLVSVVGIVLSAVGLSRASRMAEHGFAPVGRGKAIAGLVLSLVALVATGTLKAFLF